MQLFVEWIGTIFGVIGAALLASNTRYSRYGWWFFLVSSSSMAAYGLSLQSWGILTLNVVFTGTNILGILRWRRSVPAQPQE